MVNCILLAAGESKRFGSPKPLAKIGEKTILEFILKNLLLTEAEEIVVVLGASAELIFPLVPKHSRIKIVLNQDYKLGQTSSFKKGLSVLDPKAEGFMLLPIDVPALQPETINTIIKTFLQKHCSIAVPSFKGKNGHPPIFSKELRQEFLDLANTEPLYTVQHRHQEEILSIPVSDESVSLSFNTPQELKQLLLTHTALFQA